MISVAGFPIRIVIIFAAALLAWSLARGLARRLPDVSYKAAGGLFLDALFWGLIAARLGYIAQWRADYAADPPSMLAIADGGFSWWVGALAALAVVWWRTRSTRALRLPVVAGIAAGLVAWAAAGSVLGLLQGAARPLPDVQLTTLDGRLVALSTYTGRPVVLNLWASWCPPCRREMPVFEQAQAAFPGVAFVMINQGESARQALAFLEREGLKLSDFLLDPSSRVMQAMGSRGLPTTLFFDAQGRLVDWHMGELTMASLKSTVQRHFTQSPPPR